MSDASRLRVLAEALQLTVTLSPVGAVPGLYVHPDHRRRLRRPAVRGDLDV